MSRSNWRLNVFTALLFFGILTLWVQERWAVSAFEVGMFALAICSIAAFAPHSSLRRHPVFLALAGTVSWGLLQLATHQTVYRWSTWDAVLHWLAALVVFSLAFQYLAKAGARKTFLQAVLIFSFALSIVSVLQFFTSDAKAFWFFDNGFAHNVLGPFVYKNQYAAFIESVLPMALLAALTERSRSIAFAGIAAVLFASVVAGGSRTGTLLCLLEILVIPLIASSRRLIRRTTLVKLLFGFTAFALIFIPLVGWEELNRRMQESNTYAARSAFLSSSLRMIGDRPLFGFGLGTWSTAYPGYASFDDGSFVNQAHNDWVQWAAEGGIPFVLLLFVIAVWIVRPAFISLWGIGLICVFLHCLIDYPMQQRPALAAFFFALIGALAAEQTSVNGGAWRALKDEPERYQADEDSRESG